MVHHPSREADAPFLERSSPHAFLAQHVAAHTRFLVHVNVQARRPSPCPIADDDAAYDACGDFEHGNAIGNANDGCRNDDDGAASLWNDDSFPSIPRCHLTCYTVDALRVACSDDQTDAWRSLLPFPQHPAMKALDLGSDGYRDDPKGHILHLISIIVKGVH